MSEVLRAPWILQSILNDLCNDQSVHNGLNHLHSSPRLLQIIQFMSGHADSTHLLAHVSDKFHYVVSFFTDQSLGRFVHRHPSWSIQDILGAVIKITEYRFVQVPMTGDINASSIILVIEDFEHIGSDGSPAFGDPRYVNCNPAVATALQRTTPSSPSKFSQYSQNISAFTQSLDPSDLLFLESACTQTLQRQSTSFPQIISDTDWRIPDDQLAKLSLVDLPRLGRFEYDPESQVELSESSQEEEAEEELVDLPPFDTNEVQFEENEIKRVKLVGKKLIEVKEGESFDDGASEIIKQGNKSPARKTEYHVRFIDQDPKSTATSASQIVTFPLTQYSSSSSEQQPSSAYEGIKSSQSQPPMTQAPLTQLQSSPVKSTSVPSSQTPQSLQSGPVVFPKTQQSQIIQEEEYSTLQSQQPSSPIASPIRQAPKTLPDAVVKPVPIPDFIAEYPDYSAW